MYASNNGHLEVVRTLLKAKADMNAMSKVRNQMMIMVMMMMMMMMMIVINEVDRDICR